MKLGIIGLPGAGKTTIFNALTKGDAPTGQSMGGRFDVLTAVVDVMDERVDVLSNMFSPKKTTYARITYTDVAGLKKGSSAGGGMPGELLNHLAGLDGFVHVVRAFESDMFPHPDGSVDATRDLEALDLELLLNDLGIVERRIEKIEDGLRKGATKNRAAAQADLALFQQMNEALSAERPLRSLDFNEDQEKSLRGYGLLTLKPTIVILNIGDDQEEISPDYDHPHTVVANLRGKLEMELSQLSDVEAEEFRAAMSLNGFGLDQVIALSHQLLGLVTFFTMAS
ncbi:MAG: GTPase, partial [Anaerolineae bacterium]